MKKILDFIKVSVLAAWQDIKKKLAAVPEVRWLYAALVFFLLILAFMYGKGCGLPETQLNPVDTTYQLEKAELQHKITLQEQTIASQKVTIKGLSADLEASKKLMAKAMDKATNAISMYKQAKLTTDTSAMLSFCDSAINSHMIYADAVDRSTKASDSIINIQAQVIGNQEKLIDAQRQRINLTDAQLGKSMHENSALVYDNQGLQKKLARKKGKFLKGVVSGIIATIGTLIILK